MSPQRPEYPGSIAPVDHVEPVPRRIRAVVNDRVVLDTTAALYVWEHVKYPYYYVPFADLDARSLIDEDHRHTLLRGIAQRYGLRVGDVTRPAALRVYTEPADPALRAMAKLEWDAVDAWYEEDEEVFVHPRSPYVRVDALRSGRTVRVELDGVLLAESSSTVMVFETGLPTRYYFDPLAVDWSRLVSSATETACPYKGVTDGYWSVQVGGTLHPDLAWRYRFPTRQLLPITGLIAFYNEEVDIWVDGIAAPRPTTPFS